MCFRFCISLDSEGENEGWQLRWKFNFIIYWEVTALNGRHSLVCLRMKVKSGH